jgi:hypothetical protein
MLNFRCCNRFTINHTGSETRLSIGFDKQKFFHLERSGINDFDIVQSAVAIDRKLGQNKTFGKIVCAFAGIGRRIRLCVIESNRSRESLIGICFSNICMICHKLPRLFVVNRVANWIAINRVVVAECDQYLHPREGTLQRI